MDGMESEPIRRVRYPVSDLELGERWSPKVETRTVILESSGSTSGVGDAEIAVGLDSEFPVSERQRLDNDAGGSGRRIGGRTGRRMFLGQCGKSRQLGLVDADIFNAESAIGSGISVGRAFKAMGLNEEPKNKGGEGLEEHRC